MAQITVAIVGTGNVAAYHAEALQSPTDEAELISAADVNPDSLQQFCAKYHVLGRPVTPADLGPDSPFYHGMNGSGAPWG
jgi:predicted dehydrogenase